MAVIEDSDERTRLPVQVLVYPMRLLGWDWEYLLLKRFPERGGFWQGVTGGVEANESLENAARRELIEETGLYPIVLQSVDHSYRYPVEAKVAQQYPETSELEEHVFYAQIDVDAVPVLDPNEHEESRWCAYDDALRLLRWAENKDALTAVQEHLSRHRAKHSR